MSRDLGKQPRSPRAASTAAGEATGAGRVGSPTPEGAPPARPAFLDRQWRIEMPAGMELLNANHRPHWSARARITKDLRWAAYVMVKKTCIPRLGRVHVHCVYEPPPARGVRDVTNLAPSAKALVDGALVDAGVLEDDSDRFLVGPDMRRGPVHPRGRLVLIITELEPLT